MIYAAVTCYPLIYSYLYPMLKRLAIFFVAVILAGCGPRLVYPHLDWLIPWYVSDFISLDSDQKTMLEIRLSKLLDWHCRTQLPAYANTLRAMGQDLADSSRPVTVGTLQTYNARLMALWKELIRQVAPDITAILATSTDEQIDELFANLENQNHKLKREYVDLPPEALSRNRQKRMLKHLTYWISKPNTDQIQVVAEWNFQLLPIGVDLLRNREIVQAEARRLLGHRHDDPGFQAAMQDLIINPERLRSAEYQRKIDVNTDVTINYLVNLIRMLTGPQRSHLLDRIESLAEDFDTLSCDPHEVPKPSENE